ncbi:Glycine cleavage system H protein 2, mitochondrial [Vitis vinifera]|uniref:Glycine cleavage system H protein n=1 Tax=Vitis vinifera TaxID=29760 RepID=A0A438JE09_VITVI|nr:Glycine cleavage system H protein 2, mitochondrial [Vitis vinifera]
MASRLWASRAASYLRLSVFHRGFSSGKSNAQLLLSFESVHVVKDLKYADSHEWVKIDGNSAIVGITDHAQDHLGDVVYVELPEAGAAVNQGSGFGAVESVKATSDINSPVSGKVVEVNEELNSSPGLLCLIELVLGVIFVRMRTNLHKLMRAHTKNGWIIKVEMSDTGELNSLMDSEQYTKFCEEEDAKH